MSRIRGRIWPENRVDSKFAHLSTSDISNFLRPILQQMRHVVICQWILPDVQQVHGSCYNSSAA